jgi:hypothetical protein
MITAKGFKLAERPIPWGNGCGHNPATPNFDLVLKPVQNLYPFLLKCCEKIEQYYFDNSTLPTVQRSRWNKRLKRMSTRKHRTDGAEGFVRLVKACLVRMDVLSLRVGIPQDNNGFTPYSFGQLCYATGHRYDRLDRHRALGARAGVWSVHRRASQQEDGQWKGEDAIIHFNEAFFRRLGLLDELKRLQKAIYKRLKKRVRINNPGLADVEMTTQQYRPRKRRRQADPKPDKKEFFATEYERYRQAFPPDTPDADIYDLIEKRYNSL